MMQPSGKTSIQTRSLEDIMVTATPYLVFELIIFLNISFVMLSLFILVLPVLILSPVLVL